jgi:hypothetical protein
MRGANCGMHPVTTKMMIKTKKNERAVETPRPLFLTTAHDFCLCALSVQPIINLNGNN